MGSIPLKYGSSEIPFEYEAERFQVLSGRTRSTPLSDAEINQKLDAPIDSPPIEDLIKPDESVLLVVPDATRQTASGQVVNLLVRRLIANGTAAFNIAVIFATGIHRRVRADEKESILTPFIAQRIKTLDHGPRDLASLVRLGETASGIPIELNRAAKEYNRVVIIGGVTFHYFAGFTGGRKLVCPGLGSSKTINATHKLAFDCATGSRREGVGPGLLDGNVVNESFISVASVAAPAFAISTIVDDRGDMVDLFCGHWITSHRAACERYAAEHTLEINEKREIVIVSAGGHPHDINMIQAHKALENAANACTEGGRIVLIAECTEGLGRPDFLDWFEAENSEALASRLCERYQVNGQTAWSLLKKAERFKVKIVTSLDDLDARKMRLQKVDTIPKLGDGEGYIIPDGAKYLVKAAG